MISSFSQYLIEEEKTVFFTFGRMNPPTIGHGKLLDKLASSAGRNPYRVYLSQSQDPKKNPLSYTDKVKHVRKMFSKHARSVMINKNVHTAIEALVALYDEGFRNVVMVVGSDRINEFDILLNKYNGEKARHGFYNFKSIKVISAGERDPDAEGVEGMSASKMRSFVANNDFTGFGQGVPKAMSNAEARKLFNDVRRGMGLKEEKSFKNHIQLMPVSDLRESYIRDNIFELGEEVVINDKGIVGTIQYLGANYLIVESKGETWRCWLDKVSKLDPNQKYKLDVAPHSYPKPVTEAYEIGTPEYTKHAIKMTPGQKKFKIEDITASFSVEKQGSGNATITLEDLKESTTHAEGSKGLWYNIRKRREKGLPKLKPGDKNYPKTLDIEQIDHVARAREVIARDKQQSKDMIAREKEKDRVKHAGLLDKARRARMMQLNKGVKK